MQEKLKILIVDDSFIIRTVIKRILREITESRGKLIEIHTSENGVEGMGYIMLSKPDILIIDSTLPQYSGVELGAFLSEHQTEIDSFTDIKTIILHYDENYPKTFESFLLFSKSSKDFLKNLITLLKINIDKYFLDNSLLRLPANYNLTKKEKFLISLGSKAVYWSNKADYVFNNKSELLSEKILSYFNWIIIVMITDYYFLTFSLFVSRTFEDNLVQDEKDKSKYRVTYYPKLIFGIMALGIVIIQILALLAGTSEAFNLRKRFFNSSTSVNSSSTNSSIITTFIITNPSKTDLSGYRFVVNDVNKITNSNGEVEFELKKGISYDILIYSPTSLVSVKYSYKASANKASEKVSIRIE